MKAKTSYIPITGLEKRFAEYWLMYTKSLLFHVILCPGFSAENSPRKSAYH